VAGEFCWDFQATWYYSMYVHDQGTRAGQEQPLDHKQNEPDPLHRDRKAMNCKSFDVDVADVLDRINAMRSHEEETERCINYLTTHVDATCRKLMVDWYFSVVDAFNLSRETVWVAISILDRYLSSGKGDATKSLECKRMFQLASVTCFYISVKVYESSQFGIRLLTRLGRGLYKEKEIVYMEQDILFAIEWRLYASTTTPMEFARQYLGLLKEPVGDTSHVLKSAASYVDKAVSNVSYSTWRASSVGMACLAGALDDDCVLSSSEKVGIWHLLLGKLKSYLDFNEIDIVELSLLSTPTTCESLRQSPVSLPRSSLTSATSESSSPVSVFQ
jgi:hypothetical protein